MVTGDVAGDGGAERRGRRVDVDVGVTGEDTAALEKDPLLSSVDADRRSTLVAERQADGSLLFDVHLQGEKETVFLQFPGIEYPDHA